MPDKLLEEKLNQYWYKPLDELKPSIQFIASYKEKWQTLVPLFEQISAQNAMFIFIYNTIIKRFIYVVDKRKIIGYDAALYLAENGYEFSMSNTHPDYLQSVLLLQQESFNYLSEHLNQADKIVMNLEGVYKKNNGEYIHFLQQTLCLETDKGAPVLFLGYIHDITYIKKNRTSNLVLTTPNEIKRWNFNFDKNTVEPVQPLSKQEKKNYS